LAWHFWHLDKLLASQISQASSLHFKQASSLLAYPFLHSVTLLGGMTAHLNSGSADTWKPSGHFLTQSLLKCLKVSGGQVKQILDLFTSQVKQLLLAHGTHLFKILSW